MGGVIGIDPGRSGGIALLSSWEPRAIKIAETPRDIYRQLSEYQALDDGAFCFLEKVHSMPGQGVASTFKFGQGFGWLEMALVALFIPYELVTPQKWQKHLGCLTKGDKNVTKKKAQELFPAVKVTHAIADALLIAEYGRRVRGEHL